MTTPFFSIAIPTKNRPEALRDAIRSVVSQPVVELEVLVSDNSDPHEATHTEAVVASFDDPRIRYLRTSGDLSMPDNWESALAAASGEFVGVLTDRSVFRPGALELVRGEIERTGARCVSWFSDMYGRNESAPSLKRRESTFRRYELESPKLLHYFLNGEAKYATKVIPKLMNAVCSRSILEEIRRSPVGRICPRVCPDFTSGFLILAHADWVLALDEALYVSCGHGNGSAFRNRGELGDRFRRDLGMTWAEMVDRMPSDVCFSHALVLNDLMRLRDTLPERFPDVELNRVQYYVGCLNDYAKTANRGISERDGDLESLFRALAQEDPDVRAGVEAAGSYARVSKLISLTPEQRNARAARKTARAPEEPRVFASVFEAIDWAEANPREPIEHGLLDLVEELASDEPDVGAAEATTSVAAIPPERPESVTSGASEPRLRERLRAALGKNPG